MRHWSAVWRTLLRVLVLWSVSTAVLVLLAAVLPGVQLGPRPRAGMWTTLFAAASAAGTFGLLSGLVWPWMVRALLLVPALLLGLLVFALNGALVLLAFSFIPADEVRVGWKTAVVVAAALSLASSGAAAVLGTRDAEAYQRRLVRLAVPRRDRGRLLRRAAVPDARPPGTVFLQIDGLGHDVLRDAAARGHLPNLAAWLPGGDVGTHRLTRWRTDWSSQTGASQLALLHGCNEDVPAFRWFEKDAEARGGGDVMVCNHPATAAELERRATARAGPGLLAEDGASRGNLFSGAAAHNALVLSVSMRRNRGRHRDRGGYFAYFSDPANAVRTALSFVAEVVREICQSCSRRFRGRRPRVQRGGLYPLVRAFATVVERDVVTAAVVGDVLAGRSVVYADLVGYDEVAHHSGVAGGDALAVLRRIDRSIAMVHRAAHQYAARDYRIVVLSDHGQSEGEPFQSRYGESLQELVRRGRSGPHGPRRNDSQLRVLASGNLGLVYCTDVPRRLSYQEIQARHPGLIDTLVEHPGVGFVLVRGGGGDALVLGAEGSRVLTDDPARDRVLGTDPLAPYGPCAVDTVRRGDGVEHVADLMVGGVWDPQIGRVHSFEEQIGSHGGLGGAQNEAFLLHPADLPASADTLVGAEQVHRLLRGWLARPRGGASESAAAAEPAAAGEAARLPSPGLRAGAPVPSPACPPQISSVSCAPPSDTSSSR